MSNVEEVFLISDEEQSQDESTQVLQELHRVNDNEREEKPMDTFSASTSNNVPSFDQNSTMNTILDLIEQNPSLFAMLYKSLESDLEMTRRSLREMIRDVYRRQTEMLSKLKQETKVLSSLVEDLEKDVEEDEKKISIHGKPMDMFTTCEIQAQWDDINKCFVDSGNVQRVVTYSSNKINENPHEPRPVSPDTLRRLEELGLDDSDEDVVAIAIVAPIAIKIPPNGPVLVTDLAEGMHVVCPVDHKALGSLWRAAVIDSMNPSTGVTVRFSDKTIEVVPKAFVVPKISQSVLLEIGQRVVAFYKLNPTASLATSEIFAGFVAEQPKTGNSLRYLVLFDDEKSAYCNLKDLYAIPGQSRDIMLEKVIEEKKDYGLFLEKYFTDYPDVVMVRPVKGVSLKIVEDGYLIKCYMLERDASMMKVRIKHNKKKTLWMFRGSYQFKLIYQELFPEKFGLIDSEKRPEKKRTRPLRDIRKFDKKLNKERCLLQYNRVDVEEEPFGEEFFPDERPVRPSRIAEVPQLKVPAPYRGPARGSIDQAKKTFNPHLKLKKPLRESMPYVKHNCTPLCLHIGDEKEGYLEYEFRGLNPFSIPMLLGWKRELRTFGNKPVKKDLYYVAPCGKTLRDIKMLSWFLETTESDLPIDMFSFDFRLRIVADYYGPKTCFVIEHDFSGGIEKQPISAMNCYKNKKPEEDRDFEYIADREFSADVFDNVARDEEGRIEKGFTTCCDCADNCADPETCACQQLTKEATKVVNWEKHGATFACLTGYVGRRLLDTLLTGIYECNEMCACNRKCPNRLSQLGVRMLLQLFNYPKKAWGIRALHDIPEGTFICFYSAEILTPEEGNNGKRDDMYFADLDTIDIQEREKRSFNVSAGLDEESSSDNESDEEYYSKKKSKIRDKKTLEEEFRDNSLREIRKAVYDEDCSYVLDARFRGNLGRFFNHSCEPNCTVQNIYVDTHDLRLPNIAIFTSRLVKAYEELTWDYGYEVNSVNERKMWCHCGSKKCRKRLL